MIFQNGSSGRVLLVDDDPVFFEEASHIISEFGELRVVDTASDAISTISVWRPDLVILDSLLVRGDSFRVLDEIRNAQNSSRIGIVYLVKGRGATTRFQRVGNDLFGVLDRSVESRLLREHVLQALHLSAA